MGVSSGYKNLPTTIQVFLTVFLSPCLWIGNKYLPILVTAPDFWTVFFYWYRPILVTAPNFWTGLFLQLLTYYVVSESHVLPTLRCGDHESSLIQNRGLSVACCSISRCVYFLVVFTDRAGRECSPPSFITRSVSILI